MRPRHLTGKQTLALYKRTGIKTTGLTEFTKTMWISSKTNEEIGYWRRQAHLEMRCEFEEWKLF